MPLSGNEVKRAELREATQVLRNMIDNEWAWLVDTEEYSEQEADLACKDAYNAVTLLHEHATKGLV